MRGGPAPADPKTRRSVFGRLVTAGQACIDVGDAHQSRCVAVAVNLCVGPVRAGCAGLAPAGEQAAAQNVPLWRPRTEEIARAKADHNGGYLCAGADRRLLRIVTRNPAELRAERRFRAADNWGYRAGGCAQIIHSGVVPGLGIGGLCVRPAA